MVSTPLEKYESKWESSPNRDENKKYLSCHQLVKNMRKSNYVHLPHVVVEILNYLRSGLISSPPSLTWDPMIFRVEEIWKALKVKVPGDSSQDLFISFHPRSLEVISLRCKSLAVTPWKINMEATNRPFRKETHLPNHPFSGSMLVFGGVFYLPWPHHTHHPWHIILRSRELSKSSKKLENDSSFAMLQKTKTQTSLSEWNPEIK